MTGFNIDKQYLYFFLMKSFRIGISKLGRFESPESHTHLFGFSFFVHLVLALLTLVLLNPDISCFANSVDPDQLASEEANWSGSALFAIKYANL